MTYNTKCRQHHRYITKGSKLHSTRWEGSIYNHVFEHNQLLLAVHLLLQDLGCLVGMEVASFYHRQFCAEEVWRSPRPPVIDRILSSEWELSLHATICYAIYNVHTFNSSLRTKCCWSPLILQNKIPIFNS